MVKPLADGCSWKLTKKMKKKTVQLHLVLSYGGATLDQTIPVKVS